MNICFFSGDISRSGGTEKVTTLIANELALDSEYNVSILSLTEAEEPFFTISDRIKRDYLSPKWITPGPGYLPLINKVRKYLIDNAIDVIVDVDIVLDVLSVNASRNIKTRVVSWEHFNYQFEQKVLYRKIILKTCTRRSDALVTLTNKDADLYAKCERLININVIHNPIEMHETAVTQKENWIISVGHLIHIKGVDYLAKVAVKVLQDNPEWKWIVLGDGDEEYILKDAIHQYNLQERLILKGRVSNVRDYLKKSKMFVLTSRSEGMPMCMLEALAEKLPMVSFDINNGPSDIIEDGKTGYLVEPYNCDTMVEKISILIRSNDLLNVFSENSNRMIGKFSMETTIGKWKELLKNL